MWGRKWDQLMRSKMRSSLKEVLLRRKFLYVSSLRSSNEIGHCASICRIRVGRGIWRSLERLPNTWQYAQNSNLRLLRKQFVKQAIYFTLRFYLKIFCRVILKLILLPLIFLTWLLPWTFLFPLKKNHVRAGRWINRFHSAYSHHWCPNWWGYWKLNLF